MGKVYVAEVLTVQELGANKRKYWVALPVIKGDPNSGKRIYVTATTTHAIGTKIKVTLAEHGWQIRK